jgi:uncharacterized protein (DUF1501 family)
MFNIVDAAGADTSRRSFLQIGTLGLVGLSLADLMACRAAAAPRRAGPADKAVVLLFLQGGPPQHETFDPNRGETRFFREGFRLHWLKRRRG